MSRRALILCVGQCLAMPTTHVAMPPQQLAPTTAARPTFGRGDAVEWPPKCTAEGADMMQYAAPPDPGIACCEGLVACVEPRPPGYPGFGKISSVTVCREACEAGDVAPNVPMPPPALRVVHLYLQNLRRLLHARDV